jgi:peptide/nickel transport system substrate-binding protein
VTVVALLLTPGSGAGLLGSNRGGEGPSLAATGAAGAGSASSCTTPSELTEPLRVLQAEIPDSLDPAVSFSTPGWAALQQVYQGLVNYNGSSATNFSGVLARSWTVAYDPITGFDSFTFQLRTGVNFSNGDLYNAYVQWYSLYRSLLLQQGSEFILEQNFFSTNFNAIDPLSYYSSDSDVQAANATLASYLNTWNFENPDDTELALMQLPMQSFQVLNASAIQLNLGFGYLASNYTYLLASLAAPPSSAVDPVVIDAHGGVVAGAVNLWMSTNALGTGPFTLQGYDGVGGGGYTLSPVHPYWATAAAMGEPWNVMIQPANTSIQIIFQDAIDVTASDLENGTYASAAFAYVGLSTVTALESDPCLVVQALPTIYGATSGSWWVFLNSSVYPFNNLSVREAITHAINYPQIIQQAFGGFAQQWVGPVPPAYPDNNNLTAHEPYYQYNLSLAQQEIADSPCANNSCAGDSINYLYLNTGNSWVETAQFLEADLQAIGITIHPVGVGLEALYEEQGRDTDGQCLSATTANGGPFYMGQEFYTSDYVAPDDWTMNDAYSLGVANECMAGFSNATVNADIFAAASDSRATAVSADYSQITSLLYSNYSEIWLVVPTSFAFYSTYLHGVVENPMGSAEPASLLLNTLWGSASPPGPVPYSVTFDATGLPSGTSWTVTLNGTTNSSTDSSIGFEVRNGTYAFTVGDVSAFSANRTSGEVTVAGTPLTVALAFVPVPPTHTTALAAPGLSTADWLAIVGAVLVAAGVVVALAARYRQRSKGPPGGGPPGPG